MSEVCDKNSETFSECFDKMINFIFLNLFEVDGKIENNHDILKNKIYAKIQEKEKEDFSKFSEKEKLEKRNEDEKNLLKKLYVFNILFEKLDSLKPYQLSFEDIELLNQNWISNKDLISNYPSFYC